METEVTETENEEVTLAHLIALFVVINVGVWTPYLLKVFLTSLP